MTNLRFKWVGRWDAGNRQFRFFRVMWETVDRAGHSRSKKLAVSIKRGLPRVTLRDGGGGIFV